MRNKSYDVAIQFQMLNKILHDEIATLREELALQKLETAVALMQVANAHAKEKRALEAQKLPFTIGESK